MQVVSTGVSVLSNLAEKRAAEYTDTGGAERASSSAPSDPQPQAASRGAQAARGVWQVLEGLSPEASVDMAGAPASATPGTVAQSAAEPSETKSRRREPGSADVDG